MRALAGGPQLQAREGGHPRPGLHTSNQPGQQITRTEIQDMKTTGPKPKIFPNNPNLCLGVRARGGGGAVHQVPGRAPGAGLPEGGAAQLRAVGPALYLVTVITNHYINNIYCLFI